MNDVKLADKVSSSYNFHHHHHRRQQNVQVGVVDLDVDVVFVRVVTCIGINERVISDDQSSRQLNRETMNDDDDEDDPQIEIVIVSQQQRQWCHNNINLNDLTDLRAVT